MAAPGCLKAIFNSIQYFYFRLSLVLQEFHSNTCRPITWEDITDFYRQKHNKNRLLGTRILYTDQGRGSRGGGQLPPPNFLSEGDEYACAPLNFGNHYTYQHVCPLPRKKSFPRPWHWYMLHNISHIASVTKNNWLSQWLHRGEGHLISLRRLSISLRLIVNRAMYLVIVTSPCSSMVIV